MRLVADLHIHSKYSRATSRDLDLVSLARAAQIKGINIMATGDFTHPQWFKELKEQLNEAEEGLYRLSGAVETVRFILSAEISCIYSRGGKVRRIHLLIIVPNLAVADKINLHLAARGNLKADGRPILGLDAQEVAQIVWSVDERVMLIPGHIWTPWFSLFGSKSGFDSIEECFGPYAKNIFAVETGLSSDPSMNWRLSALDRISLLSNSDSHSAAKVGREANVFDIDLSYSALLSAIKAKDPRHFLYTIEFFPEEGKYHYDGHSACKLSFSPDQTKKINGFCPACHKPLVIGVLSRVDALADREEGFKPEGAIPFKNLIPLAELIAQGLSVGVNTKAVQQQYQALINNFGSEFNILENVEIADLESLAHPRVSEAIGRMRRGQVNIKPGYDGLYGQIEIFTAQERLAFRPQKTLF